MVYLTFDVLAVQISNTNRTSTKANKRKTISIIVKALNSLQSQIVRPSSASADTP